MLFKCVLICSELRGESHGRSGNGRCGRGPTCSAPSIGLEQVLDILVAQDVCEVDVLAGCTRADLQGFPLNSLSFSTEFLSFSMEFLSFSIEFPKLFHGIPKIFNGIPTLLYRFPKLFHGIP